MAGHRSLLQLANFYNEAAQSASSISKLFCWTAGLMVERIAARGAPDAYMTRLNGLPRRLRISSAGVGTTGPIRSEDLKLKTI
ncbi:hypothetical protein E4U55_002265 [Claviceps digitariae]|nr:hypothetical protein E4U55_002265 [Claviceps digitariae]